MTTTAAESRPGKKRRVPRKAIIVVGSALLLAAAIRVVGINWGVPYLLHPDEHFTMDVTQTMVRNQDLNPHFFNWPSLPFYIQGIPYAAYVGVGDALGYFDGPSDVSLPIVQTVGTGIVNNPNVLRLGRAVTMAFGVGIVATGMALTWMISRRLWITGIAGLFLALEPMLVKNSRWMTPDVFVAFFAFAATGMAVIVLRSGRWWQYAVAGAFVGFAASSKYNAILAAVAIAVAHLLRYKKRFFVEPGIYIAAATTVAAFLLTTPALVFSTAEVWKDMSSALGHYSTGHPGWEGDVLTFYSGALWQNVGPILFLIPFAFAIRTIRKEVVVLIAYPVVHLVLLMRFTVRFERNMLPVVPPLLLVAALGVWGLWYLFGQSPLSRRAALVATAAVVTLAGILPMIQLYDDTNRYTFDHRSESRAWINNNVPVGAVIARDTYAPYLDDERYRFVGRGLLLDGDAVFQPDVEYVIYSSQGSGRFIREPERYTTQVERYERLLREFCIVQEFGGYQPSIVLVRCSD